MATDPVQPPGDRREIGPPARLHPLTPVVRAARTVGLLAVIVVGQVESRSSVSSESVETTLVVLGALAGLLALRGLVAMVTTRYTVDAGELRVDAGLFSKRHQRVRLNRMQSVDVLKPLAARLFGLAELRVTIAGNRRESVKLCYLAEPVAQALRADLLGRAAGLGGGIEEATEQPLVVIPARTLVLSTILQEVSWRLLLLLVGPGLTVFGLASSVSGSGSGAASGAFRMGLSSGGHAAVAGVGTAVTASTILVVGHSVFRRVTRLWSFTVAESPDGLRIRHGLFSTSALTVPTGRVQAVRVHQPLLWRPFGWATVGMNVAGYAGTRQSHDTVLLPVAPVAFAQWLASRVIDADLVALATNLTGPPRRARWRAPWWHRRESAGSDDRVFVVRHGLFGRTLCAVPHQRTQSVHLSAGPWQRMLHLASVELDSTRGPVRIQARFRSEEEARTMLDLQVERGRRARRAEVSGVSGVSAVSAVSGAGG